MLGKRYWDVTPITVESAFELKRLWRTTTETLNALKTLGRPVDSWDDLLICIVVRNFDPATHRDWEASLEGSQRASTFNKLQVFIEGRIRTLEAMGTREDQVKRRSHSHSQGYSKTQPTSRSYVTTNTTIGCPVCSNNHWLGNCPAFLTKSTKQRQDVVRQAHACYNCLRRDHHSNQCSSPKRCNVCHRKHHSLLHENISAPNEATATSTIQPAPLNDPPVPEVPSTSVKAHTALRDSGHPNSVILATLRVKLCSPTGRTLQVRALLDPGSESSFVTTVIAQHLQLSKRKVNVPVIGVGSCQSGTAKYAVQLHVESCAAPKMGLDLNALVLDNITNYTPPLHSANTFWPHLKGLVLADSPDQLPNRIDLLLGADVYAAIVLQDLRKGASGGPVAQKTTLGWVLFGSLGPAPTETSQEEDAHRTIALHVGHSDVEITSILKKFLELEEIPTSKILSEEDQVCEQIFLSTHARDSTGRYVVRLPWNPDIPRELGDSRTTATLTLNSLNRRFNKKPALKMAYSQFLTEYESLGHMERIPPNSAASSTTYYLPHHAVFKSTSTTTKLRVVFNASQVTTNGRSLNDCLLTGPKLQQDLMAVLLRWRRHAVVFTADITKMYRQILVHPDDCDLQRILWNQSPSQLTPTTFRLNTVTYGTACAPYLAIRTLLQLAEDEQTKYPIGASIVRQDMYVDDVLSEASDVTSALAMQLQLRQLLTAGGFELHKWASNKSELLPNASTIQPATLQNINIGEEEVVRTLGLIWEPTKDIFRYQVNLPAINHYPTKRLILSDISRLFDPVGWLSPVTIVAKIFLQQLWLLGSSWDEPLPDDIIHRWQEYRISLPDLHKVTISRSLGHLP